MKGVLKIQHFAADGKLLSSQIMDNSVTIEGKNHILNTQFRGGTQQASWFFGIINSVGFTGNPNTDTMSAHSGWVEFTGYAAATRPQWSPNAPSGGSLVNSTPITIVFTAAGVLKGLFVTTNSVKGGTSGLLWSTIPFSDGTKTVDIGQELKITYTYLA